MLVVVIVAIFAAIAIPSYLNYVRRADAGLAQQELQKIAEQLERHKSRNFSYRGFDPNFIYGVTGAMNSVTLPRGATSSGIKYTITIRDGDDPTKLLTDTTASPAIRARRWVMMAESTDVNNYSYLLSSTGVRCKNKTKANLEYQNSTTKDASCGSSATGSESW
nr:type IV pilin protein [Acinetobacter tandoii]